MIEIIKKAADPKEASTKLQNRFDLSEIQAKAILDMRLQRLTGLERDKIQKEYRETIELIEKLKSILASKELQMKIIADELEELKTKYGDERRTEIVFNAQEFSVEDMIANEDVIVTITHKGFIKRTLVSTYRRQHKGGRGSSGAGTHDEDFVEHVFQAATHSDLLFFTDLGRCYSIKVYQLPEGGRAAKGRSLANLVQKSKEENVTTYLSVEKFDEDRFVFMATKNGIVKKTSLSEFKNVRVNGKRALTLKEGDRLIKARITDGSNDIFLASRNGLACRFRESNVRAMGRTAAGVIGINLDRDDYVVSMVTVNRADAQILTVGEKGMGKRTKYDEFRLTKRGAKGVISMNVTPRTGAVVGMLSVLDSEDLVVVTERGVLIRQPIIDIRTIGRNTQGVRLIRLDRDDRIADITLVSREEMHEDDAEKMQTQTPEDDGVQDTLL